MLTILVLSLASIVVSVVIGLMFGTGMRSDSSDATQVEYLGEWSDVQRLRKS